MVLDASLTLAWYLPDQKKPNFDAIHTKICEYDPKLKVIVPPIWVFEVHSILVRKLRKYWVEKEGKSEAFAKKEIADALSALQTLRIQIIPCPHETMRDCLVELQDLAKRPPSIGLQDASYLKLAVDRKLPIATIDYDLARAAMREGVKLVIPIGYTSRS